MHFEARGFSPVICLTNAHNQTKVWHKSADQVKPNFGIQFVRNLSRQTAGFLLRFQRRNRQAVFPVLCPKPNLILPRPGGRTHKIRHYRFVRASSKSSPKCSESANTAVAGAAARSCESGSRCGITFAVTHRKEAADKPKPTL